MLLVAGSAQSLTLINNGLAPPDPANVITTGSLLDDYYVRNVGCTGNGNCEFPGVHTEVLVEAPISSVEVFDSSKVTILPPLAGVYTLPITAHDYSYVDLKAGGDNYLTAFEHATISITGEGYVEHGLFLSGDVLATMDGTGGAYTASLAGRSSLIMNGGTSVRYLGVGDDSSFLMNDGFVSQIRTTGAAYVGILGGMFGALGGEGLWASDSSLIEIFGTGFAVDGSPVPYGDLTALYGNLTGTLADGESFNVGDFAQGGGLYTGTIRLSVVPEPSTAILFGIGLAFCAVTRRRSAAP